MSYSTIRHLLLILVLSFTSSTLSAKTTIAINGLSKHFNTPLVRNPYNTGIGYIYNSHEVGIYRNSRRSTSHSIYYTWNRHLVDFQKTSFGYRLGGAIYDDALHYKAFLKPIIAGYVDFPVLKKISFRVTGTYNLIGAQLLYRLK